MNKAQLERWYLREGKSLREIALINNCAPLTVRRALDRNGIRIKSRNGKFSEPNTTNHDFFANWSAEMANVLGYTVADGCVRPKKYSVSYKSIDKDLLEKVKRLTGTNAPIKDERDGNIYTLALYSKRLADDLVSLGVGPKKSLTIELPDIPERYFWDFVRGLIEGDGHIRTGMIGVSITGSVPLITALQSKLEEKLKIQEHYTLQPAGKAVTLSLYGANAIALLNKVYYGGCLFLLRRKANAASASIRAYTMSNPCKSCGRIITGEDLTIHHRRKRTFCDECRIKRQREANRRCYYQRLQRPSRGLHGSNETPSE